jgi:hypothetical protein
MAGLVILSSISIDFKVIRDNLPKPSDKKDKPEDVKIKPVIEPDHAQDSLLLIVNKWQCLKDACDKNNLTAASAKLDEIFPMLIEVKK